MRLFIWSLAILAISAETEKNQANALQSSLDRARRFFNVFGLFKKNKKPPCTYTKYESCYLSDSKGSNTYLNEDFTSYDKAFAACNKLASCGGITYTRERGGFLVFELRSGHTVYKSPVKQGYQRTWLKDNWRSCK